MNKHPSTITSASVVSRFAMAAAFVVVVLPGCTQPRRTWTPEVDPATLSDTVFLHYLARTPLVTVDEGQRAVLLLVGSTDQWPTPEARMDELIRRGALKEVWGLEPDRLLSTGTLAHMLRVICETPLGVNDRFGRWVGWGDRRAAIRTCSYEELLPYSVPHKPVTGGELVTALTRAEEYIAQRRVVLEP